MKVKFKTQDNSFLIISFILPAYFARIKKRYRRDHTFSTEKRGLNLVKVGIIGGGAAGLTAAWLLDNNCEVVLFEKSDHLGGHAHTIYVPYSGKKIPIEIGFEFFNAVLFPHFMNLLKLLNVPITPYPLTYTFHSKQDNNTLVLPPIHNGTFAWHALRPHNLLTLLQFNYFMLKAKKIIKTHNDAIGLEQFADTLMLSKRFKNNFLYPFLGAGWGASLDDFKTFAAYDIAKWIAQTPISLWPPQWFEVTNGTSAYIETLAQQLHKTTIKISTSIQHIALTNASYVITETNGATSTVDHLIFATNPQQACLLLKDFKQGESASLILKQMHYFPATVAVHGDQRFMPQNKTDWSVANVTYDGINSTLTVYKQQKTDIPLFRSWIAQGDPNLPEPLYAIEHFQHQKVTPAFFKAQKELKAVQGLHNLWFAGHHTHDIDSHESALVSAILIAQKLAPQSQRLAALQGRKER